MTHQIDIVGEINDETSAMIDTELEQAAGPILININSSGGSVFDGAYIYNALRDYPDNVSTHVTEIAGGIASVVALAGDPRTISPDAKIMIGRSSATIIGNRHDMDEARHMLERQDNKLAGIYAARAGGNVHEWLVRMDTETWYTATEAIEAGLMTLEAS